MLRRIPATSATAAAFSRRFSHRCSTTVVVAVPSTVLFNSTRGIFSTTRTLFADDDKNASSSSSSSSGFSLPSWTDPASKNLYHRLGVKKDASLEEIKKHYRHLSRMYHPDLNKNKDAEQKFLNVKEAYETLSDTSKRNVYDSTGASWSQQEQYQRAAGGPGGAGGGFPGGFYSASYTWQNRTMNPQLTRGLMLIVFFAFGLLFSAMVELKTRRQQSGSTKMSESQEELSKQRSSLWRPFFGMLIFISFLPRLPAVIMCWYFFAYRPTLRAEDRAVKEPTVVVRDEMGGQAMNVHVWSPYLETLARTAASSGGRGLDHILVVSVRPDEARLSVQQVSELKSNPNQPGLLLMEYPASSINSWSMSVPRPRLVFKSLGSQPVPVPALVTIKVKTVVKEAGGRIAPERGEVVFEQTFEA